MNCQECLDRLQLYLDGALLDGEADEHAKHCSECAARVGAARRLVDGLRLLKAPVLGPDLAAAIVVASLRDMRRRRQMRRTLVGLAVAASVLAAIAVGYSGNAVPRRINSDQFGGTTKAPAGRQPAALARTEGTLPLRDTVAEASEAVASLTSRTADRAVDETRFLLPIVPAPSLSSLDLPDPAVPAKPLREASERVSAGLEPVASSARRAVNLFLRELPPLGSSTRTGS